MSLERLGLERLGPLLDAPGRWDLTLTEGEQHSLAFARVLLHAPRWLIIDEALEALEDEQRPKVIELLAKDLAETGILYIGRAVAQDTLFARVTPSRSDDAEGLKLGGKCRPRAPDPRRRSRQRLKAPERAQDLRARCVYCAQRAPFLDRGGFVAVRLWCAGANRRARCGIP